MVQVSYFGKMDFSECFLEIGLFFLGIVLIYKIQRSVLFFWNPCTTERYVVSIRREIPPIFNNN